MDTFLRRNSQMISRLNKKSGQDSVNSSFSERNYEHSCLPKIIYLFIHTLIIFHLFRGID